MNIQSTRRYRAGYMVHRGTWAVNGESIPRRWAENMNGDYIGSPKDAFYLCRTKGIKPEPLKEGGVCRIGFAASEQKWYGWSHRAIHGFGVGDVVDSSDHLCSQSGYIQEWLDEHPEDDLSLPVGFTARTLDDARRMAVAFAEAVG